MTVTYLTDALNADVIVDAANGAARTWLTVWIASVTNSTVITA